MTGHLTRRAITADSAAIARIYNQGIEDRVATFETRPRTEADIRAWFGLFPLVAVEREGEVIAFAASAQWRTRECFRGIAEFSVYVAREHRGLGAGRAALDALVSECERVGVWKLLGGIFDDNAGSRGLMRAAGFREVGVYERQAALDGVWRNVVMVEKRIPVNEREPDRVLFACVHNAGRSQLAQALFNQRANPLRAHAISAGTEPADRLHPEVAIVLRELGLETAAAAPQRLTPALARGVHTLVTMGCGEACPVVPGAQTLDWPLADPKGRPLEEVRALVDELILRIDALLARSGWARQPTL